MARYDIGKLKLNVSGQGIAFKWGDGSVHRLPFKRQPAADDGYYDETDAAEVDGYDQYDDDSYDDRDRYSRDYDDDYYADEPSGRYADDDYDDRGEEGYSEDYDYGEEEGEPNRFLQYIEDNDWVTLALLVLLPPAGIYLLWRRQCYEKPIRIGLSIASLVWFFVLLFLLIPRLFGSSSDTARPQAGTTTLTTIAPTATVSVATVTNSDENDSTKSDTALVVDSTVADQVSASATPLPGSADGEADADYVYSPSSGLYYHLNEDCPDIPAGVTTTYMAKSAAQNRGQSACPTCYNETLYYATANGTHYHSDPTCSNMVSPFTITQEAAEAQGKTACPICITNSGSTTNSGDLSSIFANSSYKGVLASVTSDKSGVKVWATGGGENFHVKSNCRGMSGAKSVPLLIAIKAGKTPCKTCCPAAAVKVWCTKGGTYYHSKSDCTNMKGASQITVAEAMVLGKSRCPKCIGVSKKTTKKTSTTTSSKNAVYVYAKAGGKYYHAASTCIKSNMTGATRVTLKSMLAEGRSPCPYCLGSANQTVYCKTGGTYYHSKPTCGDMINAPATTLSSAIASGKKKCPKCW